MNAVDMNNPRDLKAVEELIRNASAAAAAQRSMVTRNVLVGTAAVVGAAALGIAAMIWAWGQGVDPEALKEALRELPPIQVEAKLDPNARVKMDDGKVILRDGAKVGIDGTVNLDPDATVKLDQPVSKAEEMKQLKELIQRPMPAAEQGRQRHQADRHCLQFGQAWQRRRRLGLGICQRRSHPAAKAILLLSAERRGSRAG